MKKTIKISLEKLKQPERRFYICHECAVLGGYKAKEYIICTFHRADCEVCLENKEVTNSRNWFGFHINNMN